MELESERAQIFHSNTPVLPPTNMYSRFFTCTQALCVMRAVHQACGMVTFTAAQGWGW